jgi:hypothetical protein
VAVGTKGRTLCSGEGENWRGCAPEAELPITWSGIGFGNGMFVRVGNLRTGAGVISASTDGVEWNFDIVTPDAAYFSVAFGAGRWCVVGTNGTIQTITQPGNSDNWKVFNDVSSKELLTTATVYRMALFAGGKWIAAGDGLITTANPLEWPNGTQTLKDKIIAGCVGANGKLVLVGENGLILSGNDPFAWTRTIVPREPSMNFHGISYGNGVWCVVGTGGMIFSSPDAVTWTERQFVGNTINDVHFANNQWVAVDDAGNSLTFTNAISWAKHTTGAPFWLT